MGPQKFSPIRVYNQNKGERSQSVKWKAHPHDLPVNERKNEHENAFLKKNTVSKKGKTL